MYKKMLRGIAFLLAMCLVIQLVNVSAFAATQEKTFDSLDMKITFKVTSAWEGGYNAEVSINNPTATTYEDWALELTTADEIANIWNAGIAKNEDGKYLVTNLGYNQDVKAGKTVSFGYTAKGSFTDYPEIQALKKDYVAVDESKYTVKYSVVSDWGSGANAEIAISNTSDEKLDEWKLTFDFGGNIANIWNAKIVSHEGNTYVIAGADYNQNLEAGATIKVGFTLANGSNGLKVENASLEQYDYVSEKDSFDDHEILEEIFAFSDTEEVFIDGQSKTVYLYAICEDDTKTICLYEETLGLIGEMKDDGKYSLSGDDMSGDGILSAKYTIPSTAKRGQLKFYVSDGKSESNRVLIDVYVAFSAEEIEEMEYVNEVVNNAANAAETSQEMYAAVKAACETLLAEGHIAYYVESEDKTQILLEYNTGVTWNISFVPLSDKYAGLGTYTTLPVRDDQLDSLYEAGNKQQGWDIFSKLDKIDPIQPIKAVFLNLCNADTLAEGGGAYATRDAQFEDVANALRDPNGDGVQDVGVSMYNEAKVNMLYAESNYYVLRSNHIICIYGHGGYDANNRLGVMCTNEAPNIYHYQKLTQSKAIGFDSFLAEEGLSTESKLALGYRLYGDFFEKYIGDIDNSLVSLIVCNSYGTEGAIDTSLVSALCNSGASTVTCYQNEVDITHGMSQLGYYLAGLLAKGTSKEAYQYAGEMKGFDDQTGVQTSHYILYYNTSDLQTDITNGNFEKGPKKLQPWRTVGDVRVITRLGTTGAHQKFMAFISTGVGSQDGTGGTEGSCMSQYVICKGNRLSFYYDVFSEEPMEFVGSRYDDKFLVVIKDIAGEVIASYELESVNNSTWIPCAATSPVNFDKGDDTAYHTYASLNYCELVLPSGYIDKPIEICFIVCDVGDSLYDTAAVIDDVRFIK